VAQADVVLQPRPPEIQVAVAEPQFLRHRRLLRDLERGVLRLVEHANLARQHFHLAGGDLRVDGVVGPPLDAADDADDIFRAQTLGGRHQRIVVPDDDLGDPRTVADVDEGDAAEIPDAMHPAQQRRIRADIIRPKGAAGVSPSEVAEMFSHTQVQDSEFGGWGLEAGGRRCLT
jgi:hypothetical protein